MTADNDRRLLWLGVIAPILFAVGVVAQDLMKPGFDPMRHLVSHLSLGPAGWVNSVLLVVTGGAIAAFALGLNRVGFPGGKWTGRLVAAFGWALTAAGLFPIDPGLGFPPDVRTPATTWHGQLHDVAGAVAFVSITAATVACARALRRQAEYRRLLFVCIGATLLIVSLFVATSIAVGMDYQGATQQPIGGLLERLYLAAAFGWILVIALNARVRRIQPEQKQVARTR